MTSYRKYPLGCIHYFELRAHLGLPSNLALIFILGYCWLSVVIFIMESNLISRKYSSGIIYLVCGRQDILIDFPEGHLFSCPPLFSILLATIRCHLKILSARITLFNAVRNGFLSLGAQKKHTPRLPPTGGNAFGHMLSRNFGTQN